MKTVRSWTWVMAGSLLGMAWILAAALPARSQTNSVTVESKRVDPGATGVGVGVFISNAFPLGGIALPLEIRSITSGAYITNTFDLTVIPANRLNTSWTGGYSSNKTKYQLYGPLCSGPVSHGFAGPSPQVDFISPDAVLWWADGLSDFLPAGADPTGTANASIGLVFNVTGTRGAFEIDTCCVLQGTSFHLGYFSNLGGVGFDAPILPSFTKGVITIAPPPFVVSNLNDAGAGSLRNAIDSANIVPGRDSIIFTVAGVIHPSTPLPTISDSTGGVALDGLTAPGAVIGSPTVVVDGDLTTGPGLDVTSSWNLVRGLEIRGFSGAGISVRTGEAHFNTFSGNLIYGNSGPAIDLGNDGITLNDPGDADVGPNFLANYPVFDSVVEPLAGQFQVYGTSSPFSQVELYLASESGNPLLQPEATTHGPAYRLLGFGAAGWDGVFKIGPIVKPEWSAVTALSTDTVGNTSELSANQFLTPDPMRVTAYSEPVPPLMKTMSMPQTTAAMAVVVISPPGPVGQLDSIGPTFNTFGSRATYTSAIDYNSGGIADTRVTIFSPDTGQYQIKYALIGDPGNYLTGIGIDGHAEVQQAVTFASSGQTASVTFELAPPVRGDLTGDGAIDVFDVIRAIDVIFAGALPPDPPELVDVNCDQTTDVFDVIYLIDYAFAGGTVPCQ